jgi:polyisoprenyl-phosphate glycosyltransferase
VPKKKISLIIPCYNEEAGLPNLYKVLTDLWQSQLEDRYDYELVFIDDGSKDETLNEILKLSQLDKNVLVIEFSRNFGKELATSAGINNCSGDACLMLDADLQYPVEKIPEFIQKWEEGHDVVVGVRDKKQTNSLIDKLGSYFFYKIINSISGTEVKAGALDFRLMDRTVIEQFKLFTERGRMTRALIDWLGFRRIFINYEEKPRLYGVPAYSLLKRIRLALGTFVSHSFLPLRLAGYLGLIVTFISGLVLITIFINRNILVNPWGNSISRYVILAIIILFMMGVVLACLGLIALYIANIHIEVANRPMYVIRKTHSSHKLES